MTPAIARNVEHQEVPGNIDLGIMGKPAIERLDQIDHQDPVPIRLGHGFAVRSGIGNGFALRGTAYGSHRRSPD